MSAGLPFRKRRYNAYRFNTQLGDVSADTFTATARTRPDETGEVVFEFEIDDSEAATGYITIFFDATGVDIPATEAWTDLKRATGGSAVSCHNRPIPLEMIGTPTP